MPLSGGELGRVAKSTAQKIATPTSATLGIAVNDVQQIADHLQVILANSIILAAKTKKHHWNVTGPNFIALHKLFDEQYAALSENIDEIAERIRALGEKAIGSHTEVLVNTTLFERENTYYNASEMIEELLNDHEAIIRSLRPAINSINDDHNDAGTADFLTGLLKEHEKTAWFLRAHLE